MALHVTRQRQFNCLACGQPVAAGKMPALSKVTCPTCQKGQTVPARVADLLLQERLRTLAAGDVFRGRDEPLGRKVDVLVMKDAAGPHAALIDATLRVYRALARLDHPYLQHIHRLLQCDGHWVVVTEPRMQSLGSVVGSKNIAPAQLLNLAIQAAHGLEAAASASMCHMALRPSCFQLCSNLTVHVMGFSPWNHLFLAPPAAGWATLAPAAYLAPEVMEGKRPDAQSDMYALAVCLLAFLTRQTPNAARDAADILRHEQAIPKGWARVLGVLLAPRPGDRPKEWAQVLALLKGRSKTGSLEAMEETLEDLRERSTMAHRSLHANDGKGPSGFLDGMMAVDVEFNAEEVMDQILSSASPEDAIFMTGDQLACSKNESPVDILAKAVMDDDCDVSETSIRRAMRIGEID